MHLDGDCFSVSCREAHTGQASSKAECRYLCGRVRRAMEQSIGNETVIVEYWAYCKLLARPNGKATQLVGLPSNFDEYLAIENACFSIFVTRAHEELQDRIKEEIED